MKTFLEIEFTHPFDPEIYETYKLTWETVNKPYVFLWLRELYQSFKNSKPSFARFSGFTNSYKDLDWLSQKLNKAIEVINNDGVYHIKERADGRFSQEFSNIIHHHFENLIGDVKKPCQLYWDSSPIARGAITDLNHCIHDMEAYTRAIENPLNNRAILFEFLEPKRYRLDDEALKDFTFDYDFGDICLHYGLIGKTWFEVFLDKDEEIFPEAIRPLDVLGPEFDIHFKCQDISIDVIEEFFHWLKDQGQDPKNPKLANGFLPVAKLRMNGKSQDEILEQVGKRSGIKNIRIYDEEKEWISYDLSTSPTITNGFYQVNDPIIVKKGDQIETKAIPIQAIQISGEVEGTILKDGVFKGEYINGGHTIALSVPTNGKSVILKGSESFRGVNTRYDLHIRPGEIYFMCFTEDGHYIVEKRD